MIRLFFIICTIVALAGAGWYFVISKTSADGAQIIFKGPDRIFYGVPFEFSVGVGNNSGGLWNKVELSLSLPYGFVLRDGAGTASFVIKQLGNLGDGSLTEATFALIAVRDDATAFAARDALDSIEINLAYVPAGGATVFEKKERWQGPAPEAGVVLELTAPTTVVSGEEFKITVNYANITDADMDMMAVRMNYPENFVFARSSTDPDVSSPTGNIGTLRANTRDSMVIFGRLKTAAENIFSATLTRTVNSSRQAVHEARVTVVSEQSPITVAIDANDSPDFVARLGETITYTISYVFEHPIEGARGGSTVRATLVGQLFDIGSVVTDNGGIVRRDQKTGAPQIVWKIASAGAEGGSVGFTIAVKNDFSIKRFGDRDFTLIIHAEAQTGTMTGSADHEIKVAGRIIVEARGFFRDAQAGIVNKGVFPPQVAVPTNYTIHWKLKNYATDVKNVIVRAKLEPGVRFTGIQKSTVDTKPSYDAARGEMVWTMERISATTGLMGAAPEVIFQIEGTPALDMVGKSMPLTGPTTVSALDDFTGLMLSASAPEITTALPDDPTAGNTGAGNTGIVIQ